MIKQLNYELFSILDAKDANANQIIVYPAKLFILV